MLSGAVGLFQLQTNANSVKDSDDPLNTPEYVFDGLRYKIMNDTITITGSHRNERIKHRTLIIPKTIKGLTVTKIGMHAFKDKKISRI